VWSFQQLAYTYLGQKKRRLQLYQVRKKTKKIKKLFLTLVGSVLFHKVLDIFSRRKIEFFTPFFYCKAGFGSPHTNREFFSKANFLLLGDVLPLVILKKRSKKKVKLCGIGNIRLSDFLWSSNRVDTAIPNGLE
jgi:hypothetical protein